LNQYKFDIINGDQSIIFKPKVNTNIDNKLYLQYYIDITIANYVMNKP